MLMPRPGVRRPSHKHSGRKRLLCSVYRPPALLDRHIFLSCSPAFQLPSFLSLGASTFISPGTQYGALFSVLRHILTHSCVSRSSSSRSVQASNPQATRPRFFLPPRSVTAKSLDFEVRPKLGSNPVSATYLPAIESYARPNSSGSWFLHVYESHNTHVQGCWEAWRSYRASVYCSVIWQ